MHFRRDHEPLLLRAMLARRRTFEIGPLSKSARAEGPALLREGSEIEDPKIGGRDSRISRAESASGIFPPESLFFFFFIE